MTLESGIASDLSDPSFLSQVGGYLGGEAASGIAQQGLTAANALATAGTTGAGIGIGAANLASTAGYDMAGALLNEQGIGLQSQGLAQQMGTAAQQQAIETQQYGGQQGLIQEQEKGTALAQANLAYQLPIATEAQIGGAAATGALNTQGDKQKQAGIQQQYQYNQGVQGVQAQSEFIQSQLGQLGQQSEQVGYQGQQAQMANQQQQLAIAAKQAGIPVQQAESQLQYGLDQLGISGADSLNTAMGQAAQAQSGEASGYGAVLAQAGATTGLGPNFFGG